MWFVSKAKKRWNMAHLERMKCLEMGFPLPDAELAGVEAVRLRGGQVTAVLIVGTAAAGEPPRSARRRSCCASLVKDAPAWLMPAILVFMWSVCGYLLFTLIRGGMQALSQIRRPADFVVKPIMLTPAPDEREAKALVAAKETSEPCRIPPRRIQEGWYARPGSDRKMSCRLRLSSSTPPARRVGRAQQGST